MRTGIVAFAENGSLDDLAGQLERAEGAGFDTAWVPQIFGWDTLTALAVAGRATSRSSSAPRSCPPTRGTR